MCVCVVCSIILLASSLSFRSELSVFMDLCCLFYVDVIDRLDALRGKGMARLYSWASKRFGSSV